MLKIRGLKTTQISPNFSRPSFFGDFLPESSTRRKSGFLFVIETARALTLVGEAEMPVPAHVSHEDLMYYNS